MQRRRDVLLSVFTNAGYDTVAPAIIQPADVFLDVIGESLRARTYVFTDPDGAELCLSPDLTVPTCRLHLARSCRSRERPPILLQRRCLPVSTARRPTPVTRANFARPASNVSAIKAREEAEAETVAIVIKAIEKAGLKDWSIRLGDLGLFSSVLDVAGLSPRWKKRLDDAFLKPLSFREALKTFAVSARSASASVPDALLSSLRRDDQRRERGRGRSLPRRKIHRAHRHAGARRYHRAPDRHCRGSRGEAARRGGRRSHQTLRRRIGTGHQGGGDHRQLLNGSGRGSGIALETYDRRLALLANSGIDLDRVTFSAEFGRTLAYYTGLVFEVHVESAWTRKSRSRPAAVTTD